MVGVRGFCDVFFEELLQYYRTAICDGSIRGLTGSTQMTCACDDFTGNFSDLDKNQPGTSRPKAFAIILLRSTRRRCDELLVSSSPSFACSGSPMPCLCQPNRICFWSTTTTGLVVFRRSFGGSGDGSFSLARHSNICFSRCCHLWRWACRSA